MSVYSRVVDVYLVYLVFETHDLTRLTLNYPLGGSALAVMPDQLCQTEFPSRD